MQEFSDLRCEILQLTSINMNYRLHAPIIFIQSGFERYSQRGVPETIGGACESEIILD